MGEKVEKVRVDFHNFLALLGLMSEHYGHRHRSRMLTKRPLPRVSGARAARQPIRPGMGGARAKFQRKQPLGVLNRGTGAPGVEDVSTPSNSNRATADAKGGTRRCEDAIDERADHDGVENTQCDELPRVSESV